MITLSQRTNRARFFLITLVASATFNGGLMTATAFAQFDAPVVQTDGAKPVPSAAPAAPTTTASPVAAPAQPSAKPDAAPSPTPPPVAVEKPATAEAAATPPTQNDAAKGGGSSPTTAVVESATKVDAPASAKAAATTTASVSATARKPPAKPTVPKVAESSPPSAATQSPPVVAIPSATAAPAPAAVAPPPPSIAPTSSATPVVTPVTLTTKPVASLGELLLYAGGFSSGLACLGFVAFTNRRTRVEVRSAMDDIQKKLGASEANEAQLKSAIALARDTIAELTTRLNELETNLAERQTSTRADGVPHEVPTPTLPYLPTRPAYPVAETAQKWFDEGTLPLDTFPARLGFLRRYTDLRFGLYSHTGPVRKRNEDAALAVRLSDDRIVLFSADGMGGEPDGHLASRIAVLGACDYINDFWGHELHADFVRTADLMIDAAFSGARAALIQAVQAGLCDERAGSTLIVAVVEPERYVVGAMGDGGAFVRRANGSVEPLMEPQKGASVSELQRFLSATGDPGWAPSVCALPKAVGDVLMLGTDGVMDRTTPDTILQWLSANVATKGMNMQQAVEGLVAHFAKLTGPHGAFVADDNMTLLALR